MGSLFLSNLAKKTIPKKVWGVIFFIISHFWGGLHHFWVFLSLYLSNLAKKNIFKKIGGPYFFLISHFWDGLPHFWVFLSLYLSNLARKKYFKKNWGGVIFGVAFPIFGFFCQYIYLIWQKKDFSKHFW